MPGFLFVWFPVYLGFCRSGRQRNASLPFRKRREPVPGDLDETSLFHAFLKGSEAFHWLGLCLRNRGQSGMDVHDTS